MLFLISQTRLKTGVYKAELFPDSFKYTGQISKGLVRDFPKYLNFEPVKNYNRLYISDNTI